MHMLLTAGLLTYNDGKYARRCLETLVTQTNLGELGKDWQIVVLDNDSPDKEYLDEIEEKFPQVTLIRGDENAGFGKGHNRIMQEFPAEFHAVLNNDVLYSPDFCVKLLNALKEQPKFGSATGKLLRWDFGGHPEKTNIIDSCGMHMTASHAFVDRGQGKEDTAFTANDFDAPDVCFGGSGAATIYRRTSLEAVKICHAKHVMLSLSKHEAAQFFDERMFMYKEDVDLAYRLMSQGHFCLFVPDAVAWHARTTSKPRRQRSRKERTQSAAHESLILKKHEKQWSLRTRFLTGFRQFHKWLYLLIFEPRVYFGARRLLKKISK